MPIERVFLGWDKPVLPRVADFLIERYRVGPHVDLSSCVVVVPGSRGGRRLGDLLLRRVESSGWSILPPITVTIGQFPEMLYEAKLPFASQMVQDLAWAQALRQMPRETLRPVMVEVPADARDPRWMELGMLLRTQHRELAGDGLDFSSVTKAGQRLEGFTEFQRWESLARIQQAYLHILDGLNLWDRQTARLVAIDKRECRTDRDILLVATADMNRVMREMLDQVQDHVTSLIFAPAMLADHFDSYGCIVPRAWRESEIDIACERIHYVDVHADQGQAVSEAVAAFDGQYAADEITIAVPDETVVPHVEVALQQAGIDARWGPGHPIESSRPVRLLRCIVDYLRHRDFGNLAELVRHPDVSSWLRIRHIDSEGVLGELDEFQNKHLPTSVNSVLSRKGKYRSAADAAKAVTGLLRPLSGAPRQPGEWAPAVQQVLMAVYAGRMIETADPADSLMLTVCEMIRDAARQMDQIPDALSSDIPAEQAILMVLRQIGSQRAPSRAREASIELLGWLDLFLDDAPAVVVTSFNEGFVPSSISSDLFLPNTLRSELGIDDSLRLLARDVYATSALVASRDELHVVLSRRSANADPVPPSRLLFATDPQTMVRRSRRFFGSRSDKISKRAGRLDGLSDRHRFQVPAPRLIEEPVESMRVTDFRTYLACPYRYYLKHVLKLRSIDDDQFELDAAAFGSLMHAVLDEFGSSESKNSADARQIVTVLDELLDRHAKLRFGRHVRTAVKVQIEQMRLRLHCFASVQAARSSKGWRILITEKETGDLTAPFDVDGRPVKLKGRIDRIDHHEPTDTLAILDYKSADSCKTPEAAHYRSGNWIDLQLPLYRHLAKECGLGGKFELGYVLLPRELTKVTFAMASWSEELLLDADEKARSVVRDVRQQRFWPPTYPPAFADEFRGICQDDVFDRHLAQV
jgi:hypothetical protein